MAVIVNGTTVDNIIVVKGGVQTELTKSLVNNVTVFEKNELKIAMTTKISLSTSFTGAPANIWAGGGGYASSISCIISNPKKRAFMARPCIWYTNTESGTTFTKFQTGSSVSISSSATTASISTPQQSGGSFGSTHPYFYWGLEISFDNGSTWTAYRVPQGSYTYSSGTTITGGINIKYP